MKKALSVIEITRAVKDGLEACFPYPVEIEAEISNFRPHYSGHAYFTLKDAYAQLTAVMWKSRVDHLRQPIENGQQVICTGQITVYEKTGRYQLNVLQIRPVGQGDLQARFEMLKQKLWQAGLFDESHKRPLPPFPQRVGVITSPTGAALRDIISVAQRRNPGVQLIVSPSQVQGEKAAADLVRALNELIAFGQVDVIIIGRGGGSLEDLWAFNDEALAQAIFKSPIPIVSAVGHEVDISISDLVADLRAATPSAAAEAVIPQHSQLQSQLLYYQERSTHLIMQRLSTLSQRLKRYQEHHRLQRPRYLIEEQARKVEELKRRLNRVMGQILRQKTERFEALQNQLQALHPYRVLARGYLQLEQAGKIVSLANQLEAGPARLTFVDGQREIEITLKDTPHEKTKF